MMYRIERQLKLIGSTNLQKTIVKTALQVELAKHGLDETVISGVISDVIQNGSLSERLRAVALLVKIRGDEAPKKSIRANLTYAEQFHRESLAKKKD